MTPFLISDTTSLARLAEANRADWPAEACIRSMSVADQSPKTYGRLLPPAHHAWELSQGSRAGRSVPPGGVSCVYFPVRRVARGGRISPETTAA